MDSTQGPEEPTKGSEETKPDSEETERLSKEPEPVSVRVTGWRNWGDHPFVVGLTLFLALLTGVFGVLQFLGRGPDISPTSGGSAVRGCEQIVGRWDWLSTGGVVAFTADGLHHWYRVASDALPSVNGTWTCQDREPVHFTLSWIETGLVDTLVLSADGQRLVGETLANQFQLSATRSR